MATTATGRRKQEFYLKVGDNNYAEIKAVKSQFDTALLTALGYLDELPANGNLVSVGRANAVVRGCFPIVLVYEKGTKKQTARVLCAPDKADTIAEQAKGKRYNSGNIVEVRAPRRRVFIV
jgi:hypothetical protein